MKAKRGAPKIIFFSRWVAGGLSIHIIECSMCVWDLTDYCGAYADQECMMSDLVKSHAVVAHLGVPRLVESVR
jgi:hypothetical protein